MSQRKVPLPELGEGIETAIVTNVLVEQGDTIEEEQGLVEVESEKANVEVPSPAAGKVVEIHVTVDDEIKVGDLLVTLDTEAQAETADKEAEEPPSEEEPRSEEKETTEESKEETEKPSSEEDKAEEQDKPSKPQPEAAEKKEAAKEPKRPSTEKAAAKASSSAKSPIPAGPGVRRLARELGVPIERVEGSGRNGRIHEEDVKAWVREALQQTDPSRTSGESGAGGGFETPELPDLSQWGEVEREPLSGIRKAIARNTQRAWRIVPEVAQFDEADITELEQTRERLQKRLGEAPKLTVTAIVIKVLAAALERFPRFNAALDDRTQELVVRKYIHIGCAVDTEHGLLVPVIRDTNRKDLRTISTELTELAGKARKKKLTPDESSGAGMAVTNLGGLGTGWFTPIVTWPQAAVLGIGRAQWKPVWRDGEFVPRLVMPLSIVYDHRIVDGADAARLTRWIAETLENPLQLALDNDVPEE